ncbi:MAG TPA: hypothetical protein VGR80_07055 [Steroidobacteraceae bacterium]|nr:hypothetical protein [Steroidobacteraceae bacterium]
MVAMKAAISSDTAALYDGRRVFGKRLPVARQELAVRPAAACRARRADAPYAAIQDFGVSAERRRAATTLAF